jgi:hypothetical protein
LKAEPPSGARPARLPYTERFFVGFIAPCGVQLTLSLVLFRLSGGAHRLHNSQVLLLLWGVCFTVCVVLTLLTTLTPWHSRWALLGYGLMIAGLSLVFPALVVLLS